MSIRIVLDESALVGYATLTTMTVGELASIVQEEGGALVGIPAACFLTAYADLKDEADRERLVEFATRADGVTVLLPLLGADTVEVARSGTHGIVEARRHRAQLATYAGDAARERLSPDLVLDLEP